MVSYGLLAELTVNGKYGPGETVPVLDDKVNVRVRVLGPDWVRADRVLLFQDGDVIQEARITPEDRKETGVLWSAGWSVPKPAKESFLVAIALGPGVDGLYWRTAKAYQPDSPYWNPQVAGASGAVWLAVDE
jgi:hypothetical protein